MKSIASKIASTLSVKQLVLKLGKKYIVGALNDVLDSKKKDIDSAKDIIAVWTSRTRRVLDALEQAMKYLEDNKLDDDEVDEIVAKAEAALEEKL